MFPNFLVIDFNKCTGCRTCEIACSLRQGGICRPTVSAIRVLKANEEGISLPIVCQHCLMPFCEKVCPADAISRNLATGAIVVNKDRCVGCGTCVAACPLGALVFDESEKSALKCNLCEGDPACVKFCEPKAIQFLSEKEIARFVRRRGFGEMMLDAL